MLLFPKCEGLVLLMTLLFLTVSALFSLVVMQMLFAQGKLTNMSWKQVQLRTIGERILPAIEKTVMSGACHVPLLEDVANKPKAWWRTQCGGNLSGFQYYYAIELLQSIPCGKTKINADFSRINLFVTDQRQSVLLQSIMGTNCKKGRQRLIFL